MTDLNKMGYGIGYAGLFIYMITMIYVGVNREMINNNFELGKALSNVMLLDLVVVLGGMLLTRYKSKDI